MHRRLKRRRHAWRLETLLATRGLGSLPPVARAFFYNGAGLLLLAAAPGGDLGWLFFPALLPVLAAAQSRRRWEPMLAAALTFLPTYAALGFGVRRWGDVLQWPITVLFPVGYGVALECARELGNRSRDNWRIGPAATAATCFALYEWTIGSWLGFPAPIILALYREPQWLQPISIIGTAGWTFFLVLGISLPAPLLWLGSSCTRPWWIRFAPLGGLLLASHAMFVSANPSHHSTIRIAGLQPNISSEAYVSAWLEPNNNSARHAIERARRHVAAFEPDIVIESEGGDGRYRMLSAAARSALQRFSTKHKTDYLVSVNHLDEQGDLWNAAFLFIPESKSPQGHYKSWAAPVGEASVNEAKLRNIEPLKGTKGTLGVLICIETLSETAARQLTQRGAGLLVGMTSDVSFGASYVTAGHAATAVLRAIENGRSFAWVSNAGPSRLIDAQGRILKHTRYGRYGVLLGALTLATHQTFYARAGHRFPWLLCALLGLCIARARTRFMSRSARECRTSISRTTWFLPVAMTALSIGAAHASPLWVASRLATTDAPTKAWKELAFASSAKPLPSAWLRRLPAAGEPAEAATRYVLGFYGLSQANVASMFKRRPKQPHDLRRIAAALATFGVQTRIAQLDPRQFPFGSVWAVMLRKREFAIVHGFVDDQVSIAFPQLGRFATLHLKAFRAIWDGWALTVTGTRAF